MYHTEERTSPQSERFAKHTDKTMMLFSDAKQGLQNLNEAVKNK